MAQFICVRDYEEHALKILPPIARDFYKSGADDENTLKWNREAFTKYVKKSFNNYIFFLKK